MKLFILNMDIEIYFLHSISFTKIENLYIEYDSPEIVVIWKQFKVTRFVEKQRIFEGRFSWIEIL